MIPENTTVQRWPVKKRATPKVVIASLAAVRPYSTERVVSVVVRSVSIAREVPKAVRVRLLGGQHPEPEPIPPKEA